MGRAGKPVQDDPESPADFLARWSRRKIEAGDEADQPDDSDTARALPAETQADAPCSQQPERELTDADMPAIESLDEDSDYAPFLSPGVSDGLRQKALRKLFSQPACNVTDGLNDYDDDYTQFASLGSVVTHEMKRMLKRELEAEQNRQQQRADRAQEPATADADTPAELSADPGQPDMDTDNDAADKA